MSTVHAQVEVTVPPEQRLPRSLSSLRVGLERGDSDHILTSVVEVIMVEAGQVRFILVSGMGG